MSNPILTSNQSSAVVATINESTTKNPWVYNETNRLTVPHAMQILNIDRSSGTVGANKTFTFDVAKNGVCQGMWLNMAFGQLDMNDTATTSSSASFSGSTGNESAHTHTSAAAGAASGAGSAHNHTVTGNVSLSSIGGTDTTTALGILDCIDNIRLTTSGRIIERLDKYQILARYSSMPAATREALSRACYMGMDIPDNQNFSAQLFLPFYFTQSCERYGILTNFEEPHRVEVTLSDCKWIVRGATVGTNKLVAFEPNEDGNLSSTRLLCHYRQLDEPQMNEIVSKNYGDGLLSRVVQISKTEAVKVLKAGDQIAKERHSAGQTIELKENEAVRAMYVILVDSSEPTTVAMAKTQRVPKEIAHFRLTFNNTTVMDVPGSFVQTFGRWSLDGRNGDGSPVAYGVAGMHHVYKIDFGLDHGTELTNVVAFRELSNPKLTVWPVGQTLATDELHVIYETATFLSCSSSTGRVQLSISS